jgi:hypothetical protein
MKKQECEREYGVKKQKALISQGLCRLEGQIIELFCSKFAIYEVIDFLTFVI